MKSRTRIAIAALVAAGALATPFVLRRSQSYYTDLGALREDTKSARGSIRSVLWERAAPLPRGVNTGEADEYEARVSPDGRLLVFTRGRPGGGADLWIAERAVPAVPGEGIVPGAAGWGEPRPLLEINTSSDEMAGAFAGMRGARAALYFASDRPGGLGRSDIWVSEEGEDGSWGAPLNLGPDVNSTLDETTPAVSADGSRLFFATNRRTGKLSELPRWIGTLREAYGAADQDIYVAERKETAADEVPALASVPVFATARPVPGLDTDANEGAPCLDSRVGLLYFASDRPGGRGGLDLWRARIDGGDVRHIENLGPSVNGAGHELDPAISPGGFELHFARRDPDSPTEEIFHSVSREVFLETEAGEPYWSLSALLSLLRSIPPAVLAALLSILLLVLFARILRWRMNRLALITRCFLLAILIHCLIAVWMNTKRVQRVLLAILPAEEETVELMLEGGGAEEGIGLSIRGEVTGSGQGDALPPLGDVGSRAPAAAFAILPGRASLAFALEPVDASRARPSAGLPSPDLPGPAREAVTSPGPPELQPPSDARAAAIEPSFAPRDRDPGSAAPRSDAPLHLGVDRRSAGEGREPRPEGIGFIATEAALPPTGSPGSPGPAPAGREHGDVAEVASRSELPPLASAGAAFVPEARPGAAGDERGGLPAEPALALLARGPAGAATTSTATGTAAPTALSRAPLGPAPPPGGDSPGTAAAPAPGGVAPARETLVEDGGVAIPVALPRPGAAEPGAPGPALVSPRAAHGPAPAASPPAARGGPGIAPGVPAPYPGGGGDPGRGTARSLAPAASAGTATVHGPGGGAPGAAPGGPEPPRATPFGGSSVEGEIASLRGLPGAPQPERAPPIAPRSPRNAGPPSGSPSGSAPGAMAGGALREGAMAAMAGGAFRDVPAPGGGRGESSGGVSPATGSRLLDRASPSPAAAGVGGALALGPAAPSPTRTGAVSGSVAGPEGPPGAARGSPEAASSFLPRVYALREKSRRDEAVRTGGGGSDTERAVERGLRWLALHQSPDGRWDLHDFTDHLGDVSPRDLIHGDWNGRGRRDSRGGSQRAANGATAGTGLAVLAFLGHGETQLGEGVFRENVKNGLAFLLRAQRRDGDLRGGGNLYMHAIAAFALCEAYAVTRDPALAEPAKRAVEYTLRSQNPQLGGWRYEPYPQGDDVDTSVFGWMLMALKSARVGGIALPERNVLRMGRYLDSARMTEAGGRYAYQPGLSRTSLAMTAQGLFSSQVLAELLPLSGEDELEAHRRAAEESVDYLLRNMPARRDQDGANEYYWYYATLALFQEGGPAWETWNSRLKEILLALQLGDDAGSAAGSWDPISRRAETGGRVYATAIAVLCLEVYYRYAPGREEKR